MESPVIGSRVGTLNGCQLSRCWRAEWDIRDCHLCCEPGTFSGREGTSSPTGLLGLESQLCKSSAQRVSSVSTGIGDPILRQLKKALGDGFPFLESWGHPQEVCSSIPRFWAV